MKRRSEHFGPEGKPQIDNDSTNQTITDNVDDVDEPAEETDDESAKKKTRTLRDEEKIKSLKEEIKKLDEKHQRNRITLREHGEEMSGVTGLLEEIKESVKELEKFHCLARSVN